MKVLLVSEFYPPEPNSAALKMADLAGFLTERGHGVTVVTGFPNYPDGVLHPGYRRSLFQRSTTNGITVIRTFMAISTKRRRFGARMKGYLTFMFTSIYGGIAAGRHDLVFVYSPPLTLGVSGYALSRMFGAPLIVDVNDLWPQAPIQLVLLKNPRLVRMAHDLERFVYTKSDRLFFYSSWMRREVVRSGVPEVKAEHHPFWVDTDVFHPSPEEGGVVRREHGFGEGLVVMYAGNMGLPQGLGTVIDCARLLDRIHPGAFRFVFVGGGADRERLIGLSQGLSNVQFVASQPASSMPAFMSAADVLLLHLDKAPFRLGTMPGKLLAYMSCGRPVLVGLEGEGADIVRNADCGVVVEPQNPSAMAEGLVRLLDPDVRRRMGDAGRRAAMERYDRVKLLAGVERRFQEIVEEHRRGGRSRGGQT